MIRAEPPGPTRRAVRWVLLLAVGVVVGAGLALLGGPGAEPGASAPASARSTGRSAGGPGSAVLDPAELTTWCRDVLDPRATAEFIGRKWWCAGRPGGIWRIEELDDVAACAGVGWSGYGRVASEAAVDCAIGEEGR